MQIAVEMWDSTSGSLDAIIGGGCSVVCEPLSLLAASWNVATVSYGCESNYLSDKSVYPTFTRTVGPATGRG